MNYKKLIHEMVEQLKNEELIRGLYLMLGVMLRQ